MSFEIVHGDALDVLRLLPAECVDSLVTDPPAGISFMGKDWDGDKGGRDHWIAWLTGVMAECLRVLKPGGHGLVWALPRTSHWTATALEDAGFEIRDVVTHHFGTGFPKNRLSALKPASENWLLVRKPLDGTIAANIEKHGTGAINVDACRIAATDNTTHPNRRGGDRDRDEYRTGTSDGPIHTDQGRWPANVVFSHSAECVEVGTREVKGDNRSVPKASEGGGFIDVGREGRTSAPSGTLHGDETVAAWTCVEGCPVRELDAQSGTHTSGVPGVRRKEHETTSMAGRLDRTGKTEIGYADTGGASRFFYCAKPSTSEKEAGLSAGDAKRGNTHPTVKSIALMSYLVKLITPPGGVVLDPFAGSGTTGAACVGGGFSFLGIEREAEFAKIAGERITYWDRKAAA